ncbi:LANO_0B01310g1_1 [Lachancea nothofagi CBS 11611]|uniref:LANO_0B01310g1_1 n=1 Tax=Lachancea nothofagi CBS 11611 TaxID=1266666 RepID=A0A1G4IV84_9SACH|nr:LANO_0B01310g1_1 [Lachancea nothofagi CBS 11611]
MIDFYSIIHQRASIPQAIEELGKAECLSPAEFVEELELVRSRNPYYAKKLIKALSENTQLIDGESCQSARLLADETSGSEAIELSEWVFEQYVEFLPLGTPEPTFSDIIRYTISPSLAIDVQEKPYLLCASGTTGFRTWEAALYLAEFLAQNPAVLGGLTSNSRVLELGAGTGLVSIAWAKLRGTSTTELYVTDGDSTLVEQTARHNFMLNGIDTTDAKYKFQRLWWGEDAVPNVDLILAADVTFDASVIPHLVSCLATALIDQTARFAMIAATVRNEQTTAVFESCCASNGLKTTIIGIKPMDFAPIRIYQIERGI